MVLSKSFYRWVLNHFEFGPAESNRLIAMEGLRGLAVTLVFFAHYFGIFENYLGNISSSASRLKIIGDVGVDLFFVISGYLIYGSLIHRPQPFFPFLYRRIQRLYPAFLVVLAIYLCLSFILTSESKLPAGPLETVLYIAANILLLPGIFEITPIITVAWSLSYEMAFYLTVPWVIEALRLRSWTPWARTAAFLALIVAWEFVPLPHPRVAMFLCGMILVEMLPALKGLLRDTRLLDGATLLAVLALGVVLSRDYSPGLYLGTMFVVCFLLCTAAFIGHGPVSRALSVRPLRWLGNMSYSYYLMHGLVLKMFYFVIAHVPALQLEPGTAFWLYLPLAFGLTLVGSAVLFLTVERPLSIMPAERVRKRPVVGRLLTDP